jgi:hypothetical protein
MEIFLITNYFSTQCVTSFLDPNFIIFKTKKMSKIFFLFEKSHRTIVVLRKAFKNLGITRLLLNPIFLDCKSNPNPSQKCD